MTKRKPSLGRPGRPCTAGPPALPPSSAIPRAAGTAPWPWPRVFFMALGRWKSSRQGLNGISYFWVNYNISLTWIKAHLGMISLTNHDFQWGRSEVVIIYPDTWDFMGTSHFLLDSRMVSTNIRTNKASINHQHFDQTRWGFHRQRGS